MTTVFDASQVRYILPELVLTASAFLLLWPSTLKEQGRRGWAPALSMLACALTLCACRRAGVDVRSVRTPAAAATHPSRLVAAFMMTNGRRSITAVRNG